MSRLAVLIPVLKRPHRVQPVLDAFTATTPGTAVYFIANSDDQAEQDAIRTAGGNLLIHDGGFGAKINHGVKQTSEPLILIVGDDVEPQAGWLEHATAHLTDTIQVVGINDLIERNREHAVHFLVTREYANLGTFDGIAGPCSDTYTHWYVDDELIFTAQWRSAYAYADDAHVTHLHPMNGGAPNDEVYELGRASQRVDAHTFHRRMAELGNMPRPAAPPVEFDVTIGVATFGAQEWVDLAQSRAIPSARAQGVPVIHRHEATLQDARNAVLADCDTEFLINLDADDELEAGYVAAMAAGTADLRAPAVRCVRAGRPISVAFMPQIGRRDHRLGHQCTGECLTLGNWLVCGTAARTELLRAVGGWWDEPIYEDWSLWLRCWVHGCTVEAIYEAIYLQHLATDSRNHTGDAYEHRFEWHERIAKSILGEVPA